ncbi:hypothetical protein Ancab_040048 [Ancistrocladus abbreviatus]
MMFGISSNDVGLTRSSWEVLVCLCIVRDAAAVAGWIRLFCWFLVRTAGSAVWVFWLVFVSDAGEVADVRLFCCGRCWWRCCTGGVCASVLVSVVSLFSLMSCVGLSLLCSFLLLLCSSSGFWVKPAVKDFLCLLGSPFLMLYLFCHGSGVVVCCIRRGG